MDDPTQKPVRRRRARYPGKYPRDFGHKYKEHAPEHYPDTVAKVIASGKTPAGSHRPIMVAEILEALDPKPGEIGVDCTLGYGGHAQALLERIATGGKLIGVDADPLELPRTAARLQALGFGPEVLIARRSNFAGLPKILAELGMPGVDFLFADLGVSSMQLDNPDRGFSFKFQGPLDMRMNPSRGESAAALLRRSSVEDLEVLFRINADEPNAAVLAAGLAGQDLPTTHQLVRAIRELLPGQKPEAIDQTIRRSFQALRIAVNSELSSLENLLRVLPGVLKPRGRAAILSFHSGEDRRVKKAFDDGYRRGIYAAVSDVLRPGAKECYQNPRAIPAHLRWARKGSG